MTVERVLCGTTVCYPLSVAPSFTLERALEGIAQAGLRYVELVAIPGYCEHLQLERLDSQGIAALSMLLRQVELVPVAINVAADLTTAAGVKYLEHALRVAAGLDVAKIVTAIEQTATPDGAARFLEWAPAIAAMAGRYGVVIALETHGGLINTGVEGANLLRQLDVDSIRLTYDMANVVYYAGLLPQYDLAKMGDDIGCYIAHVHLKDKANLALRDYHFPVFGTGILDFAMVFDLLERGGYQGAMAVEVELDGAPASPELVDAALEQSIAYLENNDKDGLWD